MHESKNLKVNVGKLSGKVAIVTGAGRGIGRGIALHFASEGALVVMASRSSAPLMAAAQEVTDRRGESLPIVCDVGDPTQIKEMVAKAAEARGAIDILVNCAQSWGSRADAPKLAPRLVPEELPLDWWEHTFQTGVRATFLCCQAVFPHMKERGGKIINFGSSSGITGSAVMVDYAANKEAIRGLTRSLARAWGQHRINVNVIVPAVETDAAAAFRDRDPAGLEAIIKQRPLLRLGDAEGDAGALALFLASTDSDYMTGGTFMLDGGNVML
jgi:NAD(P)-dependent dehydrogenase (short-subunit alcohol dehydrogenase family)